MATLELGCRCIGIEAPGVTEMTPIAAGPSNQTSAPTEVRREPGVLRTAVLGDSFTEVLQVPLERTWVNQLPETMAAGRDVVC